ncbi:MAG: hypothetical protein MJZ14_09665 [Paludibacteraceae bacterium]|nr:hypothetical protein [Paludibacteraceae bacterium]
MMKRLFLMFPILVSMLLLGSSCGDHYDDYGYYDEHGHYHEYYNDNHHGDGHYDNHHDYHHDGYYHYEDRNPYNYIRVGSWYLVSQDSYEQYIRFTDWEIKHYNWNNQEYDSGTYEYSNWEIRITYRNGDRVYYHINKACDSELILRASNGKEYRYVRY